MPKALLAPPTPARGPQRTAAKTPPEARPGTPVIGIESEFSLYVQDEKRLPEHIFRDPQEIVRSRMPGSEAIETWSPS